jgi:cytochrome c peroxidase
MPRQNYFIAVAVLGVVGMGLLASPFGTGPAAPLPPSQPLLGPRFSVRSAGALLPLPALPPLLPAKVALGQRLFFEPALSHDNAVSCASCHDLNKGGVDHRSVSTGIGGKTGTVNAPTVFNASLNFVQFWDGRADSLEAQAAGPVHNPLEMGSNWSEVVDKLRADTRYRQAFGALYRQGIAGATIVDALATFERSLLTPDSRFDRFLRGDPGSLNAQEKTGYQRFLDYGCASCHQGAAVGGNMFQRFGVVDDFFRDRKVLPSDLGRYNVTLREDDRHVFKVPSLRNVAVTGPYFHDGSVGSLRQAIVIMGRYQLGRELGLQDIQSIEAFLGTLTGRWQGRMLQ